LKHISACEKLNVKMSVQEFFLHNGQTFQKVNFNLPLLYDVCIYEVVRVIDGVILFVEDHVDRLFASLDKKGIVHLLDKKNVIDELYRVVRLNQDVEGNIRYDVYISNGQVQRWVYYVPHVYPPQALYQQGVKLVTLKAERAEPSVKMFHGSLRKQVEELMQKTHAYEVILVDTNGRITEGSKSNMFFIQQDKVYTAPDEMVLAGITRKKVIEVINQLAIPIVFEPIPYAHLRQYESAFLTGTSPKVLPIRKIDEVVYSVNHPFLLQIMQHFDELIANYIKSHKLHSAANDTNY